MDTIKKILLFGIPVSICNFRCHYCYLSQRKESFQGIYPEMKYTPEEFGKAMSSHRIGGIAYGNFCADGETFLVKDIDLYVKAFLEQGHYAEVVTNMTITKALERFLSWDKNLLKHLEFKCSFHYLELKQKGLLDVFAENVNRVWNAGASANIEITPSDELIPYIDEVMAFSLEHFGALPHLSIARDDRTDAIDYLTKLGMDDYDRIWSQFDSDFWKFKKTIFGVKQTGFCYAGDWSMYIDLCSGDARSCYCGTSMGDVFQNPEMPFPKKAIGSCPIAHCYNGHMLLTLGLIPGATDIGYGDIRNRIRSDGSEWLQPELRDFFNSHLASSNRRYTPIGKYYHRVRNYCQNPNNQKNMIHAIKKSPNFIVQKVLGKNLYGKIKKHFKED